MMRLLQHQLNIARQYDRPLTVMIVALNGLKALELNQGLVAYSLALSAGAIRLYDHCTASDIVGCYTENRFMVICPERSPEQVRALAETILHAFNSSFLTAQVQVLIPASIGYVSVSHGCEDVESLIAIADVGADTAIELGENTICCAAEE
jgi:diguanylate cyclase (GGDEF)-like protein